jgi:sRNA-binding carbon storage regulator CsrA
MLVISRKQGQSLLIRLPDGSKIQVMVVRAGHGPPRLGVQAQEHISVSRMDAERIIPKHELRADDASEGEE